jgi:tetratricopeptide (TPR) repeat protein
MAGPPFDADPAVLHLRGCAHGALDDWVSGSALLMAALADRPDDRTLRIDCATALGRAARTETAMEILHAGLALAPRDADLSARLAALLSDGGRHDEARACLHLALAASPGRADLHQQLAIEYAADLQTTTAIHHLTQAEALAPGRASTQLNLGVVRQGEGKIAAAIAHYRRAIAIAPRVVQPHVNLSMALLARFDLAEGFAELEHRLRRRSAARVDLPRWNGEPLAGRRLLVTEEQGHGDMMQYARFLPEAARRGGKIIVECQPGLERLFAMIEGVSACTTFGAPRLPADLTVAMMSLPHVLGCHTIERLSAALPYLRAPAVRNIAMPDEPGFRIGIVWTAKRGDGLLYARRALDRRSCPLQAFQPLAGLPGVRLYSLQKGPAVADLAASGLPIRDLGSDCRDFAATAAAIAAMDLVISVDTSVAHLAGGLGVPLWVLLAAGQADYRWGPAGETTPWYPSARLFRADGSGGWPGLMTRVAAALQAHLPSSAPPLRRVL